MKAIHFLLIAVCLSVSCASSQNNIAPEAKTKVNDWRGPLKLSAEQAKQTEIIESDFLIKAEKLKPADKDYGQQLSALQQKRKRDLKKVLSRDQFIKWQTLEKDTFKNVPVRFDDKPAAKLSL